MNYVFDPAKDARNRETHGVASALGEWLFAGPHVGAVDDPFAYGKVRQLAFGFIQNGLFVCVYVDHGDDRRIVSLRKANRREIERYGKALSLNQPCRPLPWWPGTAWMP